MERFLNLHFMLSVHLLLIALVLSIGAFGVHTSKEKTRLLINENITRQALLIAELAQLTDRNGADHVAERIITDCPKRAEFERLLVQLAQLTHRELLDTQQLFESCGGFYAERKALMVSRLEREYEVLADNVALIHTLDKNQQNYNVDKWSLLISLEQKRSDLMSEQLGIQNTIIRVLMEGKTPASREVVDLANDASRVGDSLSVLDKQIDALRAELTDQT